MTKPANNLSIDAKRLWNDLMETARIGGTARGGIRRLTLSEEDRRVRDWFKAECEKLGCTVQVDEVGNMFATRPGRDGTLPPIAMGSHLDTQPTGGKFDGVLGVLAGLECLRTLHAADYETHAPIMLVNWTNEEGSRFAPAMLGSGVHAGVFDRAYADSRLDSEGTSFAHAIEAISYRGDVPAGATRIGAMFELHIEQGPILEAEGDTIGVVTGVQGMRWYDVEIGGRESHAGSTPMAMRRDALPAAAALVLAVQGAARACPGAVATVGTIAVHPGSRNVIPGAASLSVDLRHPDAGALDGIEAAIEQALAAICTEQGVSGTLRRIWDSPPVPFDPRCLASVRHAAGSLGYRMREITSGAGHDAAYIARVAPTAMIFVPCAGGLSHNEAEEASFGDCGAGAQVLLRAVLDYDRRLAEGRQEESP
ncbi:Zn-dependent hydrolase [Bosea minatitlanensis]|uniref:Zn-dependent hydrolase n=1 Tax=Bosea minatitlanensis TaxID=128782 RepID=A0ABW0F1S7_9HYPH|nr:Zn-dependent hydrolase [Bosea minatitlanensis]MCT4495574.1 Zn-dependent hydrolase [Bosea minatitlanensis]